MLTGEQRRYARPAIEHLKNFGSTYADTPQGRQEMKAELTQLVKQEYGFGPLLGWLFSAMISRIVAYLMEQYFKGETV